MKKAAHACMTAGKRTTKQRHTSNEGDSHSPRRTTMKSDSSDDEDDRTHKRKRKGKKHRRDSEYSHHRERDGESDDDSIEYRREKRKRHHRKRKRRRNSSSSDTSESDASDSSHERRRRRRRRKERKVKKARKRKKEKSCKSKERESALTGTPCSTKEATLLLKADRQTEEPQSATTTTSAPLSEETKAHRHEKAKKMVPMSREQYEAEQSVIREFYDEESGRYRLVRGSGEIIERIVSQGEHARINQTATRGDGASFARHIFHASRGR